MHQREQSLCHCFDAVSVRVTLAERIRRHPGLPIFFSAVLASSIRLPIMKEGRDSSALHDLRLFQFVQLWECHNE